MIKAESEEGTKSDTALHYGKSWALALNAVGPIGEF